LRITILFQATALLLISLHPIDPDGPHHWTLPDLPTSKDKLAYAWRTTPVQLSNAFNTGFQEGY
jgi:hypothetical protein